MAKVKVFVYAVDADADASARATTIAPQTLILSRIANKLSQFGMQWQIQRGAEGKFAPP